tara:strand:+ start:13471 stop:13875 length:405 start_codon:yes stop_codon:yes gene_type:complete
MLVFVNGCFDVLHRGHFELLKFARELGTYLVVAIDSDTRVQEMKGSDRPFFNQSDRKFALESNRWVDEVHVFDCAEQLTQLTAIFQPAIIVVGSDYRDKPVIGSENAKEIRFFERIPNYSTTQILQSSPNRRKL